MDNIWCVQKFPVFFFEKLDTEYTIENHIFCWKLLHTSNTWHFVIQITKITEIFSGIFSFSWVRSGSSFMSIVTDV